MSWDTSPFTELSIHPPTFHDGHDDLGDLSSYDKLDELGDLSKTSWMNYETSLRLAWWAGRPL